MQPDTARSPRHWSNDVCQIFGEQKIPLISYGSEAGHLKLIELDGRIMIKINPRFYSHAELRRLYRSGAERLI